MKDDITLIPKKYTLKKLFNPIKEKCIVFRHGHIAITDYSMGDNREFEKSLSVFDEMYWKYNLIGGYYIKEFKEFRINRAYNPGYLAKFFPGYKVIIDNESYPADTIGNKLYVGPKNDFQRVALTFMASQGEYKDNKRYTQQMIDADTGDGKAQPDDTLIPTPNGIKRLDSIKVGDKVFNLYGKPVDVLGVYPQKGLQDTYEITFEDGRKTKCNPEHLWRIVNQYNITKNIPLSEIINKYKGIDKNGKISYNFAVPISDPIEFNPQDIPIDPYVIGALIGNGCLLNGELTINSNNSYVPKEISKIINYPEIIDEYNNSDYHFVKNMIYINHGELIYRYISTEKFLKDIPELICLRAEDKFIPDIYKYNSIEVRMSLLQGLLDANGCITKNKYAITYSTTSNKLKDDIIELVQSLGYLAYTKDQFHYNKYHYKNECYYHIEIICPNNEKLKILRVNKKLMKTPLINIKSHKTQYKDNVMHIINIKKVEPTKQRCILIDDPLHVYITENFIPTHNTYCGIASTCFLSAKTIIFVPFTKLIDQWKQSFINFTSIKESEIMVVQGSKSCDKIINNECNDIKVFLVVIETLCSYVKHNGNLKAIEMLVNTKAYIKIIDEVHMDMKIMVMIEALCNFKMNFYMSASPGRTDKKENWIFHSLFYNIPHFGSSFKLQEEKHITILIKKYEFIPDQIQMKNMINRRNKWLNSKSYEKELINSNSLQRKSFEDSILTMLVWSKKILKPGNKIMILMNTIDGTEYMQKFAEKVFPGDTSHYYGTMKSKEEKDNALKKSVICATVSSLGTGADIAGLQFAYNCTTYSSWITAKQVSGRCRELPDKTPVMYVEFVNFSFAKTAKQFDTRKPYLIKRSKLNKLIFID